MNPSAPAYAHCDALVRHTENDRYFAGLFAPAMARPHLYALDAFAHEIAQVGHRSREPTAREIRLQWWRETICGERPGEAGAHPVAVALADTIRLYELPKARLLAFIDAHSMHLHGEPLASLAELDLLAQNIFGTLFSLGAELLIRTIAPSAAAPALPSGDAARLLSGGDAAKAMAAAACAVAIVEGLAGPTVGGRVPSMLPLEVMERHGAAPGQIETRQDSDGLRAALAELRRYAAARYDAFRGLAPTLPNEMVPAILTATLVPLKLARLAKAKDPFAAVEVPRWRRHWALWRAWRRWPDI